MQPVHSGWPPWVLALAVSAAFALPVVAECNTPPRTEADAVTVLDTSSVLVDPLANDFDADGQPLSLQYLGDSCFGSVVVTGDT